MDTNKEAASRQNSYGGSSEIMSCSDSLDTDESDAHSSEEVQGEGSFSYRRLSRRHKCVIVSICTTSFIIMMSESIMSPLYPAETEVRGISTLVSGWVFAAYALGQVIFSPLIGKYIPNIGSRFIYLSGVFFAGGCTLLFGILEYIPLTDGQLVFVVFCFLMQIVLSIGVTAQQTAAFTMASKEFGSNFTAVFGMMEVFVGLGMTVGPAIGGFLYTLGGFHLPFVVVGCLIVLSLPFNYFLLPSVRDARHFKSTNADRAVSKPKGISATRTILRDPTALVTLLSVVLGAGVWAVLDPILEPRLTDFDLTPEMSGVIFLILSASYALGSPISSWVADRLPDNRILMVPGFLACAISHLLLGGSPLLGFDPDYREIWLTIVSLMTLGFAISMAVIPSYQIVLDVATDSGLEDNMETNGAVAGIWCSMYAVGDFIGPIFGGWMADDGGFAWTLTYTGLACIVVSILLIISAVCDKKCRKPRKSPTDDEQSRTKLLQYNDDDYLTFTEVYIKTLVPPLQMA
ncbi:MFS-type transporter SLC18B1-like [Haliotis rufescens]|uniref:MFS-type transporter SLC18B1-like n=1 Tax=Haliotis rufescens TaxID=6454 RepID=UPI00201F6846|nr:MFS-type transporter SLC18B1-like [Haliotis rufescens]XP_046368873.2 MFS-type transporter SLC18B1-like [Haliotis rufescens]XP_046368874.2 MFS-type transporter SLC18B1-like [Haliotis rufescens]XP_048257536.1 MFS-type transporter SLC18B1-like [Haliotis rufescens]